MNIWRTFSVSQMFVEPPGRIESRENSGFQRLTDFSCQTLLRERLSKQESTLLRYLAVLDGKIRISRHVKYFRLRMEGGYFLRYLCAAHAWHHHVGQQEVDLAMGALSNVQSRDTIGSFQNGVTVRIE